MLQKIKSPVLTVAFAAQIVAATPVEEIGVELICKVLKQPVSRATLSRASLM
jgi:hypothetical protein